MPTDTPSALPNAPQCLSCGRSTISFITAAPFFGCTACGQPWEEKCKLCNRNREAHLREEKRHKNMHTFESPLPPNAPPNYGKMLVDEWGILPELSSQHGRKIWEKTVQLYEEVLKLRALPPPQARTPPREIMLLIDELGVKAAMVEHVSDYGTEATGRRGREILHGLNKVRDYILAGAESAPQEAGARPDFLIMASMLCLNKGRIEDMLPEELRDFLSDIWDEMELVRRGVPLEETKLKINVTQGGRSGPSSEVWLAQTPPSDVAMGIGPKEPK